MAPALPFIGAGLAGLNAIQGARQQSQQNKINQQTLEQLAQRRYLGRLLGREGAVGNPFSASYAPLFEQMK